MHIKILALLTTAGFSALASAQPSTRGVDRITAMMQGTGGTQTAPPATPPPAAPAVRQAKPAPTSTITIQVADSSGLPLGNVQVTAQGALSRDGVTGQDGTLRLMNMRAGNYRLRFVREGSITLERDLSVKAGEPQLVDVSLSAAPPPPKPPEPPKVEAPPPSTAASGPPADPKVTPIPAFLDKNLISGREPQKESSLGCTSTATATLHQLREAWVNRSHADADEWLYVVAGEATLRLSGNEQHLQAGTFGLIPHTIGYSILPTGRNPLILVSVLSGTACTK